MFKSAGLATLLVALIPASAMAADFSTEVTSLLTSSEYQTDIAPIQRLYQGLLERHPDFGGFDLLTRMAKSGTPLTDVAQIFLASPEFQVVNGNGNVTDSSAPGFVSDTNFITLLFNLVLGRTPNTADLVGWVNFLAAGHTRAEAALGFTNSSEFLGNVGNDSVVDMMFSGLQQTTPAQSDIDPWSTALDNGTQTLQSMANFFLTDPSSQFGTLTSGLSDVDTASFVYNHIVFRDPTQTELDTYLGSNGQLPPPPTEGTQTPEPGTLILFGIGLVGIAGSLRMRKTLARHRSAA